MATTWYVAPDATTVPGVTPVAIGTSGYGTFWDHAAKWSDFQTAGGVQSLIGPGDFVKFLAGEYLLSAMSGGWSPITWTNAGVTLQGRTVNGKIGHAVFKGTRDWPWPANGDAAAATVGETFIRLGGTNSAPTMSGIFFRNMQYSVTTNGNGTTPTLGTLTQTDCGATNVAGGLMYTGTKTDGLVNVVQTRCKIHGYSKGNAHVWGSITLADCVIDSEFQTTNRSADSATSTSAAHVLDALAGFAPGVWPGQATNCVFRNNAAGDFVMFLNPHGATAMTLGVTAGGSTQTTSSITTFTAAAVQGAVGALSNVGSGQVFVSLNAGNGTFTLAFSQALGLVVLTVPASTGGTGPAVSLSGYAQGDGFIGEENAGTFIGKRILTYNNGDRGIDLKCSGTLQRHISWGDNTAGIAHHLDTVTLTAYQCIERAGNRPWGNNQSSTAIQASGAINTYMSVLIAKPNAAQQANNAHALAKGDDDISKFQGSIYGSLHQGSLVVTDSWGYYSGSVGTTETLGIGGTPGDNGRTAALFGLTPSTSYNFAVRALAQDGSASAYSASVPFTMDPPGIGDTTAPAVPTGLAVSTQTSSSVTLTWNQNAPDAGTALQGYIFAIDFGDGNGFIPTMPGKSASPVLFTGLKPATGYAVKIAAYDCNGNLSAFSTSVSFTTSAGTTNTNTPSAPALTGGSPAGVASGWISHPTMAGMAWQNPSSGTVAYYEIKNVATGLVVARCLPIGTSTPTYTKKNGNFTSV